MSTRNFTLFICNLCNDSTYPQEHDEERKEKNGEIRFAIRKPATYAHFNNLLHEIVLRRLSVYMMLLMLKKHSFLFSFYIIFCVFRSKFDDRRFSLFFLRREMHCRILRGMKRAMLQGRKCFHCSRSIWRRLRAEICSRTRMIVFDCII